MRHSLLNMRVYIWVCVVCVCVLPCLATATLLSIYNAERDDSSPSSAPPAAEPSLSTGRALPALSSGAPPSSFGLSRAIGSAGSGGSGGNDTLPLSGLPSLFDNVHLPSLDIMMPSIYHTINGNHDTKKYVIPSPSCYYS